MTNGDNLDKNIEKPSSAFKGWGKLKDLAVKLNIDENMFHLQSHRGAFNSHPRKGETLIENRW